MGLTLCVVAGGDLFTSNCMYSATGLWEGGQARGWGLGQGAGGTQKAGVLACAGLCWPALL